MAYSNFCPQLSLITNCAIAKANNSIGVCTSNSICFVEPACLVLAQYVNKCKTKVCNNLVYYIYVINNIKHDIQCVHLKDILPRGVNLISTHVDNGKYEHYDNKIFYNIYNIKPNSFSKITLIVCPNTAGKKINSIEVTLSKSKFTVNNPSKICSYVFK